MNIALRMVNEGFAATGDVKWRLTLEARMVNKHIETLTHSKLCGTGAVLATPMIAAAKGAAHLSHYCWWYGSNWCNISMCKKKQY